MHCDTADESVRSVLEFEFLSFNHIFSEFVAISRLRLLAFTLFLVERTQGGVRISISLLEIAREAHIVAVECELRVEAR